MTTTTKDDDDDGFRTAKRLKERGKQKDQKEGVEKP
jgi:hypothetical protein